MPSRKVVGMAAPSYQDGVVRVKRGNTAPIEILALMVTGPEAGNEVIIAMGRTQALMVRAALDDAIKQLS